MKKKFKIQNLPWKAIILVITALMLLSLGTILIWVSTFRIPDLGSLQAKALPPSTKIYDRTGTVLLYDLNQNTRRTVVSFDQISQNLKNASVAIEDAQFYTEGALRPLSILRAIFVDVISGSYAQGGSTITQQVIKNTLLTSEKSIPRKIKEWVLAIRLEQIADKDTILNLYLNSIPYGGNIYGAEQASETFFGIHASDLDVAQAAYLASIPQAPSYYSPYGPNLSALVDRKNLVLQKMLDNKFITQDQYTSAKNEVVTFLPQDTQSIKAPHFVMYIKNYLEQKYGDDMVENGGLKVITTLDYSMQSTTEQIVKTYALQNAKTYNASNAAVVITDPKTGQILTMVGSRDYFDTANGFDGNFNVAVDGLRQPGSTFKPFVYADAFNQGYTPDTVLFDVKTEFSTGCSPQSVPLTPGAVCYSPTDFTGTYSGPMTIRDALGGSINVPAVKMLYMVGIPGALQLSQEMGITTLTNADQYGLTLVLGGGEVTPLDMAGAYDVFADNGVKNTPTGILSVQDSFGNVLEQYQPNPTTVLPLQTALEINDILADNQARASEYTLDSPLNIPGHDVAVKTGTTNNYVDAWIIGYTPDITVAAWAGNNDDTPMVHQIAGYIVAPMWRQIMDAILPNIPNDSFQKPDPVPQDIKPVLRGVWQTTKTILIDRTTGQPASSSTSPFSLEQETVPDVHDILYWVNKNDPLGPAPTDPNQDPQYASWEYGVQQWLKQNPQFLSQIATTTSPLGASTSTSAF